MIAKRELTVAGLFAGIGGLERGFHQAGLRTVLFCEIDPGACAVLQARYPSVPLEPDIRHVRSLPDVEVVAAGFPCQDLSQAGKTKGIRGRSSGLVSHVFRLLRRSSPRWLVLENVPFMLALQRGRAMRYLAESLQDLGFRWAYRVVETRAFGLPQRRQRVILVASRDEDPRTVLFADDAGAVPESRERPRDDVACGFYWTEGTRGLGWGVNCVPTLKGGSTIGIPSPPAIWSPDGLIGTPDIRDAERLQGFPAGWTSPAQARGGARNTRWKLVGNAVSVPVARWLGSRLVRPGDYRPLGCRPLRSTGTWPDAAWSDGKAVFSEQVSSWPQRRTPPPLHEFLRYPLRPLSPRATAGFLDRAKRGTLRFEPGFLDAVQAHCDRVAEASVTS